MTEPNELVHEYLIARAEMDKAKARLDDVAARLIKEMESEQRKSFRWTDNSVNRAVTYVRKHTTEIDERGLRRALKAKVYDRYTVRKLDRKAMEAAMDAGDVDPITVSRFVTQKPHKPYLEYREKEVSEEW